VASKDCISLVKGETLVVNGFSTFVIDSSSGVFLRKIRGGKVKGHSGELKEKKGPVSGVAAISASVRSHLDKVRHKDSQHSSLFETSAAADSWESLFEDDDNSVPIDSIVKTRSWDVGHCLSGQNDVPVIVRTALPAAKAVVMPSRGILEPQFVNTQIWFDCDELSEQVSPVGFPQDIKVTDEVVTQVEKEAPRPPLDVVVNEDLVLYAPSYDRAVTELKVVVREPSVYSQPSTRVLVLTDEFGGTLIVPSKFITKRGIAYSISVISATKGGRPVDFWMITYKRLYSLPLIGIG